MHRCIIENTDTNLFRVRLRAVSYGCSLRIVLCNTKENESSLQSLSTVHVFILFLFFDDKRQDIILHVPLKRR